MNDSIRRSASNAIGGFAWLSAWAAASIFGFGALLVAALILLGPADPYAGAAFLAVAMCLLGVAALAVAAVASLGRQLLDRSISRARAAAAAAALAGAVASGLVLTAARVPALELPGGGWPFVVAAVSLLTLGAVFSAPAGERHPAIAFAAIWVVLVAVVTFRTWTDVRVEVVWLGPNAASRTGTQVAFRATRSGEIEVRFGAHSCVDGRVVASGRYEWRSDHPGSALGAPAWVDLPYDVLPLRRGDVVRVCLRDGLAAGTASGEVIDPPSFWPRN